MFAKNLNTFFWSLCLSCVNFIHTVNFLATNECCYPYHNHNNEEVTELHLIWCHVALATSILPHKKSLISISII